MTFQNLKYKFKQVEINCKRSFLLQTIIMLKVEKEKASKKRENVSSSKICSAKKSRLASRKRENLSVGEIKIIKKVDEWIKEAIQRERNNQPVFPIKNQAKVVSDSLEEKGTLAVYLNLIEFIFEILEGHSKIIPLGNNCITVFFI